MTDKVGVATLPERGQPNTTPSLDDMSDEQLVAQYFELTREELAAAVTALSVVDQQRRRARLLNCDIPVACPQIARIIDRSEATVTGYRHNHLTTGNVDRVSLPPATKRYGVRFYGDGINGVRGGCSPTWPVGVALQWAADAQRVDALTLVAKPEGEGPKPTGRPPKKKQAKKKAPERE